METLRAKLTHKLVGITVAPASTITDTTIINPGMLPNKHYRETETHHFTTATGAAKPPNS